MAGNSKTDLSTRTLAIIAGSILGGAVASITFASQFLFSSKSTGEVLGEKLSQVAKLVEKIDEKQSNTAEALVRVITVVEGWEKERRPLTEGYLTRSQELANNQVKITAAVEALHHRIEAAEIRRAREERDQDRERKRQEEGVP